MEVRKGASGSNNLKVVLWSEAWQHADSEPQEVQTCYLTLTHLCKTQGVCLTFIRTSEQPGFCAINPKENLSVQTNCFCSLVHRNGGKQHYKSLMAKQCQLEEASAVRPCNQPSTSRPSSPSTPVMNQPVSNALAPLELLKLSFHA